MRREALSIATATALTISGCANTEQSQYSPMTKGEYAALQGDFTHYSAYWNRRLGNVGTKLTILLPGQSAKCEGVPMHANESTAARYCFDTNTVDIPTISYEKFLRRMPAGARKAAAKLVAAHEFGHGVEEKRRGTFPEGDIPDLEPMADCFAGVTIRTLETPHEQKDVAKWLPQIFYSANSFHNKEAAADHGGVAARIGYYNQGVAGSNCERLLPYKQSANLPRFLVKP